MIGIVDTASSLGWNGDLGMSPARADRSYETADGEEAVPHQVTKLRMERRLFRTTGYEWDR